MTLAIYIILILVGLYDLWLWIEKKKTLSQRYWPLFPKAVDLAIMVGICIAMGWCGYWDVLVVFILGLVGGHLLWRE